MAFDGVFLHNLINEIRDNLIDGKIDKINQPEKDEIIITVRKNRINTKLLLSSSPNFPRIHFTEINKENPLKAPMFLMVLRKYLIGGKITDIYQKDADRIAVITVEASDELGFNSEYSLIVEIMGRHSNITLVRNRDNKIMDSIKHISMDMNSYRVLYPGIEYVYPPKSNKLNPYDFTIDDLNAYISNNNIEYDENFLFNTFTGFSKPLSKSVFVNLIKDAENKNMTILNFCKNIDKNNEYKIYLNNGIFKDFHSQNIYDDCEFTQFDSLSSMLDKFYSTKDKQERLINKSANLQKLINTNIERCNKKEKILNTTLKDCNKKETYKIKGDLLTSFIYMIKQGEKSITLNNFYSETNEEITIKLDEAKSPSENIQFYYKKYNKLKKSEEMALEQLESNSEEIKYLQSVLTSLINVENYNEIDDIKKELIETGYIKYKKTTNKKEKSKESKPYHFISSTGIDIYVGKNNIQNDYLSLKFANKNDTWLHTKDIPGSHVIIKSTNIDDTTLEEASIIAAYYSKNKNNSKVPVDYTLVKNLRKPNGAKPGMVIYYTNKTILADPQKFETLNITKESK